MAKQEFDALPTHIKNQLNKAATEAGLFFVQEREVFFSRFLALGQKERDRLIQIDLVAMAGYAKVDWKKFEQILAGMECTLQQKELLWEYVEQIKDFRKIPAYKLAFQLKSKLLRESAQ